MRNATNEMGAIYPPAYLMSGMRNKTLSCDLFIRQWNQHHSQKIENG